MTHTSPSKLIGNKSLSLEYFTNLRWQNGQICPSCFSNHKLYVLNDKRFKCSKCFYRFNHLSNTYLGRLYIPIEDTSHLLYLFTMDIPAFKTKQYLPVSLKTAHRAYRIFRKAIYDYSLKEINSLKIADTSIAFKSWPIYKNKFVMGFAKNGHKVHTFPLNKSRSAEIISSFKTTHSVGDLIYGDQSNAFSLIPININITLDRQTTPHKKRPDEDALIEQYWNYFKNRINNYRGIPKKYFPYYLKEAEFRFNHKHDDLFLELSKLVTSPINRT